MLCFRTCQKKKKNAASVLANNLPRTSCLLPPITHLITHVPTKPPATNGEGLVKPWHRHVYPTWRAFRSSSAVCSIKSSRWLCTRSLLRYTLGLKTRHINFTRRTQQTTLCLPFKSSGISLQCSGCLYIWTRRLKWTPSTPQSHD